MSESRHTGDAEVVVRLAHMERGQQGTIVRLDSSDTDRMHKLLALGVLPGAQLVLETTGRAHVFRMGYSRFAIDSELAQGVLVRVDP